MSGSKVDIDRTAFEIFGSLVASFPNGLEIVPSEDLEIIHRILIRAAELCREAIDNNKLFELSGMDRMEMKVGQVKQ